LAVEQSDVSAGSVEQMTVAKKARGFNPHPFLSTVGKGRHMLPFKKKALVQNAAEAEPLDPK
jgi:hypothetical protein